MNQTVPISVLSATPYKQSLFEWLSSETVAYSAGSSIVLWNPFGGEPDFQFISGISGTISALTSTNDGEYLAAASVFGPDSSVLVFDTFARRVVAKTAVRGHIMDTSFSSDGFYLALCHATGGQAHLTILDWSHGMRTVATAQLHEATLPLSRAISSAAMQLRAHIEFLPLQSSIVALTTSVGSDGRSTSDLQIWTVSNDILKCTTAKSHALSFSQLTHAAVSPSSGLIFAVTRNKVIALDSTGQLIGQVIADRLGVDSALCGLAVAADLAIVSTDDGRLVCIDPASFAVLGVTPPLSSAADVIQLPGGKESMVRERIRQSFLTIKSLAFSKSGAHVIARSDRSTCVLDVGRTSVVASLYHAPSNVSCSSTPNSDDDRGDLLAQGTGEGLLYMWRRMGGSLIPTVVDAAPLIDPSLDPTTESSPVSISAVQLGAESVIFATRNGFMMHLSADLRTVYAVSALGQRVTAITAASDGLICVLAGQTLSLHNTNAGLRTVCRADVPASGRLQPALMRLPGPGMTVLVSMGGPGVWLYRMAPDRSGLAVVGGLDIPGGFVAAMCMHPSKQYAALMADNGCVHLLHLPTLSLRGSLVSGIPPLVDPSVSMRYIVSFDPAGLYLVVAGGPFISPIVNIFETGTTEYIGRIQMNSALKALCFARPSSLLFELNSGAIQAIDLRPDLKRNIENTMLMGVDLGDLWSRFPLYFPDRVVQPVVPHQVVPSTNMMKWDLNGGPTAFDPERELSDVKGLEASLAGLEAIPPAFDDDPDAHAVPDKSYSEPPDVSQSVSMPMDQSLPKTAPFESESAQPQSAQSRPDPMPRTDSTPLPAPMVQTAVVSDPAVKSGDEQSVPAPEQTPPLQQFDPYLIATVVPDETFDPAEPNNERYKVLDETIAELPPRDMTGSKLWRPTVTAVRSNRDYIEDGDDEYAAEPVDKHRRDLTASSGSSGRKEEMVITLTGADLGKAPSGKHVPSDEDMTLVSTALADFERMHGMGSRGTSVVASVVGDREAEVEQEQELESAGE
ncbi:hypothetical protein J8273_7482 [Carpediemonas membranifera]|uniref:Uncharacterized protein n=1 Tax=Carpediemonas membranifera TaxID=201153 RepID=A0A8J6DZU1_9EUKA|nr:hypothetical protein J8273_7482 [Carpediemonas membranifera]|eukprot:KAG9391208.1 hypothetical protein J8273_7482 [Carpediemonas membranifera]